MTVAYVHTCRCLIQPATDVNLSSQNPKIHLILKKLPDMILARGGNISTRRAIVESRWDLENHTNDSFLG